MVMVTKRAAWYQNKMKAVFGGVKVIEENGYFVFISQKRARRKTKRKKEHKLSRKLQRKHGEGALGKRIRAPGMACTPRLANHFSQS